MLKANFCEGEAELYLSSSADIRFRMPNCNYLWNLKSHEARLLAASLVVMAEQSELMKLQQQRPSSTLLHPKPST